MNKLQPHIESAAETVKNIIKPLGVRRLLGGAVVASVLASGGGIALDGYRDLKADDKAKGEAFASATTKHALDALYSCNFSLKHNEDGTATLDMMTGVEGHKVEEMNKKYDTLLTDRGVFPGVVAPVNVLLPNTEGYESAIVIPRTGPQFEERQSGGTDWSFSRLSGYTFKPEDFTIVDTPDTLRAVLEPAFVLKDENDWQGEEVNPIVTCTHT